MGAPKEAWQQRRFCLPPCLTHGAPTRTARENTRVQAVTVICIGAQAEESEEEEEVKLHEAGMLEVPPAMQQASRGAISDERRKQGCSKVKSRSWKNLTKISVRVDVHAEVQRCGSVPARWGGGRVLHNRIIASSTPLPWSSQEHREEIHALEAPL